MERHVRLPGTLREVFWGILDNRAPELLAQYRHQTEMTLSTGTLKEVQELLGDELMNSGLTSSDMPTEYGLQIEELIGFFSPY